MTKAERIEEFVKVCFELFHLNYEEYFCYDFEDGVLEEISWVDDKGKIIMSAVEHASEVLGISVEDILSKNREAMMKWLRKYSYLELLGEYYYAYEKTFYTPEFEVVRLAERIFDSDLSDQYTTRYDYVDIKKRMLEKLKLKNLVEPGAFHENATINNLRITTENFCSYDRIEEMTISFIDMINNSKQLFLKAINTELNKEEINEYNLLVSILGMRDRFYTRGYLYYSQLQKVRDFYKDINQDNFSDSIIFKQVHEFKPWRCSEFICNRDLVQKYLDVLPQTKADMRVYALDVTRFRCEFVWSDAKPIMYSPEEEKMLSDFNAAIGEEDIPLEKRAKERSCVDIDKTVDELNGEDKTAEMILSYCRPVKLGGLSIKIPSENYDASIMLKHISTLLGKVEHNNYIERIIARNEVSGGAGK